MSARPRNAEPTKAANTYAILPRVGTDRGASLSTGHQNRSPDRDHEEVLEIQQDGMRERRVVDARQVNDVPPDEPDRERNRRAREERERPAAAPGDRRPHRGREPGDQERRSPVRDDHVLQQVEQHEVLDGDGLERRIEGEDDQEDARAERERPRAARRVAPGSARVGPDARRRRGRGREARASVTRGRLTPAARRRRRWPRRAGVARRGGGGRRRARRWRSARPSSPARLASGR